MTWLSELLSWSWITIIKVCQNEDKGVACYRRRQQQNIWSIKCVSSWITSFQRNIDKLDLTVQLTLLRTIWSQNPPPGSPCAHYIWLQVFFLAKWTSLFFLPVFLNVIFLLFLLYKDRSDTFTFLGLIRSWYLYWLIEWDGVLLQPGWQNEA